MIVVISCAGSKAPNAGRLLTPDGRPVQFVAHPDLMEESRIEPNLVYASPDAQSGFGATWRERLAEYNEEHRRTGGNPSDLLPAFQLYKNRIYRDLAGKFGPENVFILSAGWGLIRSDFLTPQYDITFSGLAPDAERRDYGRDAGFRDFNALAEIREAVEGPVLCIAGKDYLPIFGNLSEPIDCEKLVIFATNDPPDVPGCRPVRYTGKGGTNWQYRCARDLIDGKLEV
ncbi:MAG: hypothetical protein OYI31_00755 [Chloroflexota bacterium]|nr:hypothetical protein [Chloroflexota bacterium]MDE2942274.1 hypothetical protein [Chloroflexota bacterium]MDE3266984.1 hypothetical protein [Chloroflexota bacterium]